MEFIPLARAAALLHARLFPQESVKDAKTLDLLAVALSAVVRLYVRDTENGALRALDETEIAAGRFTRGAMRLEFADRLPLRFLLVSRAELYPAIDTIAKDELTAARISRTLRRQPGANPPI